MIMYLIEISNSRYPVYLSEIRESRNKIQFVFSTDIEDALRYGTIELAKEMYERIALNHSVVVTEHEF
jgi:hypothetical protein